MCKRTNTATNSPQRGKKELFSNPPKGDREERVIVIIVAIGTIVTIGTINTIATIKTMRGGHGFPVRVSFAFF